MNKTLWRDFLYEVRVLRNFKYLTLILKAIYYTDGCKNLTLLYRHILISNDRVLQFLAKRCEKEI